MIIKLAYDTDWEHNGQYGIAANRPLGQKHDLLKSLLSAAKDPNVNVNITDFSSNANEVTNKGVKTFLKNKTSWNRSHDWSVGMSLDSKSIKNEKDKHQAIMKYLREKHGF